MMNKIHIFPESKESAKFVTGISGWVDREGRFYGKDEALARWSGATHKRCDCGEIFDKDSYCKICARRMLHEKYQNAKKMNWDRETPLYSQKYDEYIFDEQELIDFMEERFESDADELELFICEPVMLRMISINYWKDDLTENAELSQEIITAVDELNELIKKEDPVGWRQGKFAVSFPN